MAGQEFTERIDNRLGQPLPRFHSRDIGITINEFAWPDPKRANDRRNDRKRGEAITQRPAQSQTFL